MSTRLDSYRETKRKLAAVTRELVELFPGVDPALVAAEVHAVSKTFIVQARFCDFIPVLTYRYARERLRDGRVELRRAA